MSRLAAVTMMIAAATIPMHASAKPMVLDFGDDAGEFTHDNECDDMRFSGSGMTSTPLLSKDIAHDATDCSTAFFRGDLTFNPMFSRIDGIKWGDDSSDYARDGECDDMRFQGAGLTSTPLLTEDIGHDATDCRKAFEAGRLDWNGGAVNDPWAD